MAANSPEIYTEAWRKILAGDIQLETDSFRAVLVDSSFSFVESDTAWSARSANELANGNGYATHGLAATFAVTEAAGTHTIDTGEASYAWPSFTGDPSYIVFVRDADGDNSLAGTDAPIAAIDLDSGVATVSVSNGDLTVTINAGGIMSMATPAAA